MAGAWGGLKLSMQSSLLYRVKPDKAIPAHSAILIAL